MNHDVWKVEETEITDLLQSLIAVDTQNPPGNEATMVKFIVDYLGLQSEQYDIIEHGDNRESLIVTIPGKTKDIVMLLGHLDTVPKGDEADWKYSSIQGQIVSDKLYGLGASDMKSGIAVMLIVARQILKREKMLSKTIRLVFTADEEDGCKGAKAVTEGTWMDGVREVLLGEPTDGQLAIAEKGTIWLELTLKGKQAHGAMPKEALNSNEFLWKAIDEIKNQVNEFETSELLGSISISTTIFHGGFKSNIIPGTAKAMLDIRTVCESNHKEIRRCVEQIKRKYKKEFQVSLEYNITNEKIVLEANAKSNLVRKIASLMERDAALIGIPYYTDLAELLKDRTSEFVILGPGAIRAMHKVDEYVYIKEISRVADIYLKYINNYC